MEKSIVVDSSKVSLIEFDVESQLLIGAALQDLVEQMHPKSQDMATDDQSQQVAVKYEPGNDSLYFGSNFNEENYDATAHILQHHQMLHMSSGGNVPFITLTDMTQDTLQVKHVQYRPHAAPGNVENLSNTNLLEVLQNENSKIDDANEGGEIIECDSDTDDDNDDDDDNVDNNVVEENIEIVERNGEKYTVCVYSDDEDAVSNDTDKTNTYFESDDYEKSISYICPKCGQSCADKTDWLQHTNDVHQMNDTQTFNIEMSYNKNGKRTYVCQTCKKILLKGNIYVKQQLHYISHLSFKKYQICNICNKSFHRTAAMKRHFFENHRGMPKKIVHTTNLNKYEQNLIYICPECGQSCGNKTSWLQHTNEVHQFDDFNTLQMNTLHNEYINKIYECKICNKTIHSSNVFGSVKEHYISHLPFKKYHKCKICKKSYHTYGEYRRHVIRSHESKPKKTSDEINSDAAIKYLLLICQVCAEPQVDRRGLYLHLQNVHNFKNESMKFANSSDGKLYTCTLCNVVVKKESVERHMLLHEPHNPFVCTFCNLYSTTTRELFVKHVVSKHLQKNN